MSAAAVTQLNYKFSSSLILIMPVATGHDCILTQSVSQRSLLLAWLVRTVREILQISSTDRNVLFDSLTQPKNVS